MEILMAIAILFMAVGSSEPVEITPTKKVQEPNKYADRPYGSVKYLEDM